MSSETLLLEEIRQSNDIRSAGNREWVGGLYFLLALAMATFAVIVAFAQTYVINLEKCAKYIPGLRNVRATTIFFIFFFEAFYFIVTVFGGMTGWIVSSSMLGFWLLVLLIVGIVRRVKHRRDTKQMLREAAAEDDRIAKDIASGVFTDEDALNYTSGLGRGSVANLSSANDAAFGNMEPSSAEFGSHNFKSAGMLKSMKRHDDGNGIDDKGGATGKNSDLLGGEFGGVNASMEISSDGDSASNEENTQQGQDKKKPKKAKSGVRFGAETEEKMVKLGIRKNRSPKSPGLGGSSMRGKSWLGSNSFSLSRKDSVFDPKAFARRNANKKDYWTTVPEGMHPLQRTISLAMFAVFVIILAMMWVILLSWRVEDYRYLGKDGRSTNEVVPIETAQALQFLYAFPKMASRFQLDLYVKIFTEYCHNRFTKTLDNSGRETEIGEKWIQPYAVNMSEYPLTQATDYPSVNAWLIREINLVNRPAPISADAITSPVDGRTLIYVIQEDLKIWLKGSTLTYADLLGNIPLGGTPQYYNNGAAVISRLAPQDYHRFHSPVSGTVLSVTRIEGSLWSVGPDASFSENDVLLNNRIVVMIDAGIRIGNVAVIAIGATCVGSIELQTSTGGSIVEGSYLERGEQMGWIQFGGSTVVTLFSQGRILWDDAIIYRSRFPVETEVLMNHQLGVVRP